MNPHLLTKVLLSVALALSLVAASQAQTSTPSAPPTTDRGTGERSATDRGGAPQPGTPSSPSASQPRSDRPADSSPAPGLKIESRSESRSDRAEGAPRKILGVDPTLAMVLGAALLVIIIVALVAMTKRSENVPTRRSV